MATSAADFAAALMADLGTARHACLFKEQVAGRLLPPCGAPAGMARVSCAAGRHVNTAATLCPDHLAMLPDFDCKPCSDESGESVPLVVCTEVG